MAGFDTGCKYGFSSNAKNIHRSCNPLAKRVYLRAHPRRTGKGLAVLHLEHPCARATRNTAIIH